MDKSRVPSNNIPSSIPQLKTLNTRNLSLIINEIRYYPNLINEQIQKKARMNDKCAKVVCKWRINAQSMKKLLMRNK